MAIWKGEGRGETDCCLLQAQKSHTYCILKAMQEIEKQREEGEKSSYDGLFLTPPCRNHGFLDLILRLCCDQANSSSPLCGSCPGTQVLPVWVLVALCRDKR